MVEILIPLLEIFDRRQQAGRTDRVKVGDADLKGSVRWGVTNRHAFHQFCVIVTKVGMVHAEGLKDVVGRELAQGFPAYPFDNLPQQCVSRVAIHVARA